jgi:hypothetical protein
VHLAEVEVAEVAEVQKLQVPRVADKFNKLSVGFFSLALPPLKFSKCCRFRGPRNFVQLAGRGCGAAVVKKDPTCQQVQQFVRSVFLAGITFALKFSKCFRFRDIEEVEFAEVSRSIGNRINNFCPCIITYNRIYCCMGKRHNQGCLKRLLQRLRAGKTTSWNINSIRLIVTSSKSC